MAKVDVLKNSFTGGEFGASLKGRTDVAQYDTACAVVENMLARPYGPVISTPGTWFIKECKYSALGTDSTVRLIPFVFNQTDAYVIEMGDKYFRFYTDRGAVISSGSTVLEVAHPYTEDELFEVQFTQLNDVIWMAHKNHAPQILTRVASNNWTIDSYDFLGGPFLDDNTTAITLQSSSAVQGVTNATITLSATTSTIKFQAGHVGSIWKMAGLVDDETQGCIKITAVSSATVALGTIQRALTSAGATTDWAEGAWSGVRGYPAKVIFHESRLFFARTDEEPQKIWGSKQYIYDDFALDAEADDDGLNIKVASNQSNEIQWLASGNSLIAGTYGGAFIISGGADDVITPGTVTAKQEISFGAEDIPPKRIGNFFYYVQRFGKRLRELFYLWDNDSYRAADKTILNPEVTGDGIVDMAFQEVPDTMLWCVRSDGQMAVLTREIDQEVQGWSRQITDGYFESVCSIPSQSYSYDEIWAVVKREIDGEEKRYIEVFENVIVPDRQDKCLYLHSALEYDAFDETETSSATISLSGTSGSITITSSTAYFSEDDEGMRIRAIDADGATVGEMKITAYSSSTVVLGTVTYDFDATTYAGGSWGLSVDEISGLDHLEAKDIKVLADGGLDKPDKTVSGGSISLAYNYFVVMAGLPYTQKVATLPFDAGSAKGTAQGKKQRIAQVMFKLNRSHLGFKTGGTEDLAEQVSFRDPTTLMGTPGELFTGTLPNINFKDDYRYGSQVYVINEDPLPIEILSITAMMETFDK